MWAEWARDREAAPVEEADRARAAEIAMRAVFVVRGASPPLRGPVEVILVDDDIGGPYPPPSREPFTDALRAGGIEARIVERPSGDVQSPVVIALFGDIRAWKNRAGYSAATREAVRRAVAGAAAHGRDAVVAQFSHPRLGAELPEAAHVVCAWGGERAMQEAMARRLVTGVMP